MYLTTCVSIRRRTYITSYDSRLYCAYLLQGTQVYTTSLWSSLAVHKLSWDFFSLSVLLVNSRFITYQFPVRKYCRILYKPESHDFQSLWGYWISQLTESFQSQYGLGFHSASNRIEYQEFFWGKGWKPHRHLWADYLENVGASTSQNRMGLHGL
jgi:hypothetical protein